MDKPKMSLIDQLKEDAKKYDKLSKEEKERYNEDLKRVYEDASKNGVKTVSIEKLLNRDEDIPFITLDNISTYMNKLNESFFLKSKTRDNKTSKWKNKMYITGSETGFNKYFDEISDTFIEKFNDDIYYLDTFEKKIIECYEDEYDKLLSQMNLMIVLITDDLLERKDDYSRFFVFDMKISRKYNISILPIYITGSIYMFNNVFGSIEYIDYNKDFDARLSNYYNASLINDLRAISNEFTKKIFISYRKKDATYAKMVIEILENDEYFWDISLWYDDYLTPGEDYNDEIDKAIIDCDVFLVIGTNNLKDENNYVTSIELPRAKELNKKVVTVKCEDDIDLDSLKIDKKDLVLIDDEENLISLLVKALPKKEDNTPKHLYDIALAYFYGVHCPRDNVKASRLLFESALNDYLEAILFIARNNRNLQMIYDECPLYEKGLSRISIEGKMLEQNAKDYYDIANPLSVIYFSRKDYNNYIRVLNESIKCTDYLSVRKAEVLESKARVYYRLTQGYYLLKNKEKIIECSEKASLYMDELMNSSSVDKPYNLYMMVSIAIMQGMVSLKDFDRIKEVHDKVCNLYNDLKKTNRNIAEECAFEYAQFKQMYMGFLFQSRDESFTKEGFKIANEIIDIYEESDDYTLSSSMLSSLYNSLCNKCFMIKEYDKAIMYAKRACEKSENGSFVNKNTQLSTYANSLFNYANINLQTNRYEEADKYFKILIDLCKNNTFSSRKTIYKYACDYYCCLLVVYKDYKKCHEIYDLYVEDEEYSLERSETYLSDCLFFHYRSAYIYLNLEKDKEGAMKCIKKALMVIKEKKELNDNDNDIINEIMKMIKK